jgi:hypothetical protein
VGLTVMKMAVNGTNPRAIMVVIRAQNATRWVIAMKITINRDPHVHGPACSITVAILWVWATKQGQWRMRLDIYVCLTISRCERLALQAASNGLVGVEMTIPAFDWLFLVANTELVRQPVAGK